MRPGHYTELFFLDEATALAAGHRPCAECRRQRYAEFREAWIAGNGLDRTERLSAPRLDAALHADRVAPDGSKVTFSAVCGDLPDGVFVVRPDEWDEPLLLWKERLWAWRPGGYEKRDRVRAAGVVDVLTPRPTVNALHGYVPSVALPDRWPSGIMMRQRVTL
jgi:hypothetical protein